MRRYICFILAFAVVFLLLPGINTNAANIDKGFITGTGVAMRSAAGSKGDVILKFPQNAVVKILKTNVNYEWHQVEYNGKTGYVNRIYVNWDISLPEYKLSYTGKVTNVSKDVNVRSEPNGSANILGAAKKDETLKVTIQNAGNGFTEVDYNGKKGYIASKYLSIAAKVDNTQLRSLSVTNHNLFPDFSPNQFGYMVTSKQESVQIKCEANSGVKVEINGRETKSATISTPDGGMSTVRIALNGKVRYTVYIMRNVIAVGTYNVKSGSQAMLQGRIVKNELTDILGLQEVKKSAAGDQTLSYKTRNMQNTSFGQALKYSNGGGYGVGLVSRYKLNSVKVYKLPSDGYEQRVLQRAEVTIGGKKVSVYNTHLSWNSAAVREKQFKEISRIMKEDKTAYKILMGDFNAKYPEFVALGNYEVINKPTTPYYNYQGKEIPYNEIDNIIVTKNIKVVNTRIVDVSYSDHKPIFAYLVLK